VSFLAVLAIAVGLAMDAFAVSLGIGLKQCQVSTRTTVRLAWHFGLFQFFMPILGWLAGLTFARWITSVDHWIAFALLTAIGGKMIYEALWGDEEKRAEKDATRGSSLVVLSVATSIDASRWRCSGCRSGTRRWSSAWSPSPSPRRACTSAAALARCSARGWRSSAA
jgi:putative Mn2+ efflux pump MntP